MAKSKKHIITEENFNEWLSSVGFLFPSNLNELARFEKLYSDYDHKLNINCVDPFKIVEDNHISRKINFKENIDVIQTDDFRIAARNFDGLPEHILKKIKKNHDGLDHKKERSSDEKDQ